MKKKIYIKTVAILILIPSIAQAYLDPVTSLIIFQSIIAFIASVYGFIFLKPIRFIKKIFSGKNKIKNYSESIEKKTSKIKSDDKK